MTYRRAKYCPQEKEWIPPEQKGQKQSVNIMATWLKHACDCLTLFDLEDQHLNEALWSSSSSGGFSPFLVKSCFRLTSESDLIALAEWRQSQCILSVSFYFTTCWWEKASSPERRFLSKGGNYSSLSWFLHSLSFKDSWSLTAVLCMLTECSRVSVNSGRVSLQLKNCR